MELKKIWIVCVENSEPNAAFSSLEDVEEELSNWIVENYSDPDDSLLAELRKLIAIAKDSPELRDYYSNLTDYEFHLVNFYERGDTELKEDM